jgi:hypothetical protein
MTTTELHLLLEAAKRVGDSYHSLQRAIEVAVRANFKHTQQLTIIYKSEDGCPIYKKYIVVFHDEDEMFDLPLMMLEDTPLVEEIMIMEIEEEITLVPLI